MEKKNKRTTVLLDAHILDQLKRDGTNISQLINQRLGTGIVERSKTLTERRWEYFCLRSFCEQTHSWNLRMHAFWAALLTETPQNLQIEYARNMIKPDGSHRATPEQLAFFVVRDGQHQLTANELSGIPFADAWSYIRGEDVLPSATLEDKQLMLFRKEIREKVLKDIDSPMRKVFERVSDGEILKDRDQMRAEARDVHKEQYAVINSAVQSYCDANGIKNLYPDGKVLYVDINLAKREPFKAQDISPEEAALSHRDKNAVIREVSNRNIGEALMNGQQD